MAKCQKHLLLFVVALVLGGAIASLPAAAADDASLSDRLRAIWTRITGKVDRAGIASSNGRLESQQIAVATKIAGRVVAVLVDEGEIVDAGETVARLDAAGIEAQLRGAEAQLRQARQKLIEAEAVISQRKGELEFARQEYDRAAALRESGYGTQQILEAKRSALTAAEAAHAAALAARDEAEAAIEAAAATVAQLQSTLDDTVLTAPKRGRIEYRLVQPGEVVASGTSIATLLDLTDVYLTIFLPAADAGRLRFGDEARIILDPAPDYVVPATVSFVASEAQFTPKSVETSEEREKLMFRVKLKIAPDLLMKYEAFVKTGVRGVGFVRRDPGAAWPADLAVKLPE